MQNYSSKPKNDLRERAYKLGIKIIKLVEKLPNKRSAWIIGDQIIRSGTSIGANLVEATASSSRLEFKKFNEIALKSANETKYWLRLLEDTKLANSEDIDLTYNEVSQIANMIASGVIKLKSKNF